MIRIRGINPYVHVDAKLARSLRENWRKPLPVLVRINGQPKKPWRINMMPAGDGSFYLYLREVVRKASETKVGDQVQVELSFDKAYTGGLSRALPSWFKVALEANPRATVAWNNLAPSRKKEVVRYFLALKSSEAKARNLRKVMDALLGQEVRFMARTWRGGK